MNGGGIEEKERSWGNERLDLYCPSKEKQRRKVSVEQEGVDWSGVERRRREKRSQRFSPLP